MNESVLVFGRGSRETALARSLRTSGFARSVAIVPGNADPDSLIMQPPPAMIMDYLGVAETVRADLAIVGPEQLLADGIADLFTDHGRPIIGSTMEAAQLESSKIFAKNAMRRWDVPTADYKAFGSSAAALDFLARHSEDKPRVVKADGLTGGKGVIVAANRTEAIAAVKEIAAKYGERMVIEDKLEGCECTYTVFVRQDGAVIALTSSADHKRLKDRDQGPNTGGMGCYAPHPAVTAEVEQTIIDTIVCRTLQGLAREKIRYSGFLYFGLMLTSDGPKVLEYNVRLGDPEATVILPLTCRDFWEMATMQKRPDAKAAVANFTNGVIFNSTATRIANLVAVSVVLASQHYPAPKHTPVPILGIREAEATGAVVLHAATKKVGDDIMTNGGRVLTVVATGATYAEARAKAYAGVGCINFEDMQFRTDIAEGL